MKKFILVISLLIISVNISFADEPKVYAEITKFQTGWTAIIATELAPDNNQYNNDIIPKMSQQYYILPPEGKLFDTYIFTINYLSKTYNFKLIDAYQINNNTSFIMECETPVTIKVTTNFNNSLNKSFNY